jgi:hypothetical protein
MFHWFKRRDIVSHEGKTIRIAGHGRLIYEDGDDKYLVKVVEGSGYGIVIEEMGDADLSLLFTPAEHRRRVAVNIRKLLARRGILVEIYEESRPRTVE